MLKKKSTQESCIQTVPAAVILLLLILMVPVLFGGASEQSESAVALSTSDPFPVATDQLIVKYIDAVTMDTMSIDQQEKLLLRMNAAAGVELEFLRPMSGDAYVYRLPERMESAEVEAVSRRLMALPEISLAEPDTIVQAADGYNFPAAAPDGAGQEPDDPYYIHQWHYRYTPGVDEGINLPPAWDVTTGSDSTVVAVIDTGITDHVEFRGRVVPGYDFIYDPWISNDGDGRDPDPSDPGDWDPDGRCRSTSSWHGTHVAGTIAASSNNGIGVAGINWQARILPIRVLGRCGGYISDVLDGARWAAGLNVPGVPKNENPADILNLSLGGPAHCSASEQAAFDEIFAAGMVVVVAAGNESDDAYNFSPASCDRVITVAATDRVGNKAGFSNYGSLVEISAPGSLVFSTHNSGRTVPGSDSYTSMSGTSMATPHVAGVASLLMGQNPNMTPAQVLARIEDTARAFLPDSTCTTSLCGAGIIDAGAALESAEQPLETPALNDIANPDGSSSFSVEWTAVGGAEWYKLKENRDDTTWEPIYEGPAASFPRKNLARGSYCYRVRAFHSSGFSEWSEIKCTRVGPEPTITPIPTNTRIPAALDPPVLSDIANPDEGATFNVEWTAVGGAEWYKVKENHNSTTWEPVYEGPETILLRANLFSGDYCYRARAFNAKGYSDWSDVKCTSVREPVTPTPSSTPSSTPENTPTTTPGSTPTATPGGEATPPPPSTNYLFIPVVRAAD